MKALVWTGKEEIEVQERAVPDERDKILIKVAYAGICGSDVSVYFGKHPRAKAPLIMGHEFSGIIEAIDDNAGTNLKPGDKVVVNPLYYCGTCRACLKGNMHVCRSLRLFGTDRDGGMAQYAAVPAQNVLKLPDDMDLQMAAVIEPAAVVIHGLRMIKKDFYTTACVTGLGPIGLLSALMLRDSGVKKVYAVETNPKRAEYAENLGICVINPMEIDPVDYILRETNEEGVDFLVEASGSKAVAEMAAELVGVRGEVLVLSVFKEPAKVDLRAVNFKEQIWIGTRVYKGVDFFDAIEYVRTHEEVIRAIVSHVFPISKGPEAFQKITAKGNDMMKVLIDCQDIGEAEQDE